MINNKPEIDALRKRFLYISNKILSHVKRHGFQKKGNKCTFQVGEIIFSIEAKVGRPWCNSNKLYEFSIDFMVETTNSKFIHLYSYINNEEKTLAKAPLMWTMISQDVANGVVPYLQPGDTEDHDENFIKGVTVVIDKTFIPLTNSLLSMDDIIKLVEKEHAIERSKGMFYKHQSIYNALALLYAYRGWKEKTIEMCDKKIEATPITARDLAEKLKAKYIKYFETNK